MSLCPQSEGPAQSGSSGTGRLWAVAGPGSGYHSILLCVTENPYYEKLKTLLGYLQQIHSGHSGPAGTCVHACVGEST